MSYEKCKNIILKPKANQIFITTATNNDRPLHYYKGEYTRGGTLNFEDKLLNLMLSMIDGNIQISQLNKNTIPFEYAILKVRNYYRENNIDEYGEKFDKRYELYNKELSKYVEVNDFENCRKFEQENRKLVNGIRNQVLSNLYKTEFELFKNSIEEEIQGKYYLKDKYGRVIEYVRETNRGYSYRAYPEPNKDCLLDYKLAYILKDRMGKEYELAKYEEQLKEKIKNSSEEEEEEYEE